ncbi:MAG: anaerobic ribonucleoside-triphosphate reductase activating protein [Cellulosilyticaceae bacterium]
MLQVAGFLDHSLVNGEGFRTTLFLSGCLHACPGCHNQEMQHFGYGEAVSLTDIWLRIQKNLPLVDGVTISGGDPFEQADSLLSLLKQLRAAQINVWVYTGYLYTQLLEDANLAKLLPYIDVLVEGPYVASLHTERIKYVGSSNQRILHLENGQIKK